MLLRQNDLNLQDVVIEVGGKKRAFSTRGPILSSKPDLVRKWAAKQKRSEASPGTGDHSSVGPGSVSRRHRIIASSYMAYSTHKGGRQEGQSFVTANSNAARLSPKHLPLEIVETFDDQPEHIRAKAMKKGQPRRTGLIVCF